MADLDAPETGGDIGLIAPIPRVSIHVFCDSTSIAGMVESAAADRRMQNAKVKTRMGGIRAALAAYRNEPTADVIVLEVGADSAAFLADLDGLAEFCDEGTRVVVMGRINDITLYRALIARGVSEYLVEPFHVLEFVRAISELFTKRSSSPLGRIIGVYGAKGGVGASTVAHHLSWSISTKLDMSVVLVDLDLPFGTAGLDFNQDPLQGVAEAVFSPDRLDANMLDRLMTKCGDHLSLLAAPATLVREYDFNEEAFDGIMDLLRGSAPVVVLDIPHMWTAWARRLLVNADEIVLVAEPDLGNLRNIKNVLDFLGPARSNDAKPKLVMNRVGVAKRPEIPLKEFTTAINVAAAAAIPFDPKLFGTAANNGQMVAEIPGGAKLGDLFLNLGRALTGKPEIQTAKKSNLIASLKSTKLPFSFAKTT
jgi:pilus assembly protein CpaE